MTHRFALRVYYEDTDLAGIVYYANYLKFIERARTEMVRAAGIDQTRLKAEHGLVFAVKHVEADYISPAKFDDELQVETVLTQAKGASFVMEQTVLRDATRLFFAKVQLVCLNEQGHAARLPADIRQRIAELAANTGL